MKRKRAKRGERKRRKNSFPNVGNHISKGWFFFKKSIFFAAGIILITFGPHTKSLFQRRAWCFFPDNRRAKNAAKTILAEGIIFFFCLHLGFFSSRRPAFSHISFAFACITQTTARSISDGIFFFLEDALEVFIFFYLRGKNI